MCTVFPLSQNKNYLVTKKDVNSVNCEYHDIAQCMYIINMYIQYKH